MLLTRAGEQPCIRTSVMAMQAGSPATPISPQVVGNAFVQQYYHILHDTPDQLHKFYDDASRLGRTDPNGVMECVTTLHEINNKIMSMDFSKYLTEIETADAQLSHNDGVLIVVTGSLTGPEGVRRGFTQSFFLAPQKSGGYFVLNDMFRFILERPPVVIDQVYNQEKEINQNDQSVPETVAVAECAATDHVVVQNKVADGEVPKPTVDGTIVKSNATVEPPVQVTKEDSRKTPVAASPPPPPVQKDVTKKSYASIVKVMNSPATPVVKPKQASKPVTKPVTKAVEGPDKSSAKPSQAAETTPADGNVTDSNTAPSVRGYSVFVKNLLFNATVQMVEEEFKKFGAIRPGGIQVRNNKNDGFCFGFVEFESQQSMQAAIEASPIYMGENEVCIEEKRAGTRVGNGVITNAGGGGRGRGMYRGDNFRGRGGYVSNDNYRGGGDNFNRRNGGDNFNRRSDAENLNRRHDLRNQNEFPARGRGPPQGNGYHHNHNGQARPFQNENGGRYTRVTGPKQTPVAA